MTEVIYIIFFFVFGIAFGSFFDVVATRLPKNESIVRPRSFCTHCKKTLKWYELIPLVSYVIQFGKCRNCHEKIPFSSFIMELVTGILFAVSYHVFGLSLELVIALIFISALVITIISDIEYMIILDEVLLISTILITIVKLFDVGLLETGKSLLFASASFVTMYLIKLFGDVVFKKESLGGGDIKLMFLFGLVLGYPLAICSILLGTFIAFPLALIVLITKKDNMIPFGPFLSIAALLILISDVTFLEIKIFLGF